jgi:hypothetical protein
MDEIGSFMGVDEQGTEYEIVVFATAYSNLQGHHTVYTYFYDDKIVLDLKDGSGHFKLRDAGIIITPKTHLPTL